MGPPSARKVREGRSEVRNQKMRRDQWGKIGEGVESCRQREQQLQKQEAGRSWCPEGQAEGTGCSLSAVGSSRG